MTLGVLAGGSRNQSWAAARREARSRGKAPHEMSGDILLECWVW